MERLPKILAEQYAALDAAEVAAVIFAISYLILAIRQNIYCWLFAILSTALFVFLYFTANLYMESVLNVFYFGMAIYGWVKWRVGDGPQVALQVAVWPLRTHAIAIGLIVAASAVSGYLLTTFTDAAYPYIDSTTTFSAIWATFLVARKVLENWWYWLVIDFVSIFIYWSRDLELTAVLFAFYVALIPVGLVSWTRSWHAQSDPAVA